MGCLPSKVFVPKGKRKQRYKQLIIASKYRWEKNEEGDENVKDQTVGK